MKAAVYRSYGPPDVVTVDEVPRQIEAAGPAVSRFAVGEDVFGSTAPHFGEHAEYACLSEQAAVASRPAGRAPACGCRTEEGQRHHHHDDRSLLAAARRWETSLIRPPSWPVMPAQTYWERVTGDYKIMVRIVMRPRHSMMRS
jgi:hypothetical protein